VVEILVDDFIAPLLCFGLNFRTNDKSKDRRPFGKTRSISRKAKSLLTEEESTVASTDVDSNSEDSFGTREHYYGPTMRAQERMMFDESSVSEELTDFQVLTSRRRRLLQHEQEDHRVIVLDSREEPLLEHEELRNELRTIRQQSSRLQSENTNLRRLYETSKLSHDVQATVNHRLKAKNQLLHNEGQSLQLELDEMKYHVASLRLEQSILEDPLVQ
ncbi:MAG: hypothetical protein SGBAC_008874, partial [Bacillariaceae sp.]